MPAAMDETYGAMLIGVFFANFLQGILTLQTYIYFENFPDDGVRIKLLVASVWALDAAHLVLICHSTYHYLVTNWGVPAALLISTRPLDMHLIFVGASAILCQAFFINRIWVFSKNNMLLTALLSLGSLATFGLEVAIAVQTLAHPVTSFFGSLVTEIITLFAIAGAVDVFIALVLVYYLQRGLASTPFHRMRFVIARVMQFTVATGLATSVLAIGCLITYLVAPQSFIYIAMHFSLGRLYTNALLATLNARRSLRSTLNADTNCSFPTPSEVVSVRVSPHKQSFGNQVNRDRTVTYPLSVRKGSSKDKSFANANLKVDADGAMHMFAKHVDSGDV